MVKRKNVWIFYFLQLVLVIISVNCATARKIEKHPSFDYENIYSKKYIDGKGGIIRITLEKGETYSGSISPDEKYLFYNSNRDGNFDIFMRPLNDIISIPLMKGSTNQTEPSISPDGKYLLFVDDELDPEGDIVSLKIKPESITRIFSKNGQSAVDAMFIDSKKYITNNPENLSRSRESNPTWSPNGKWIAYASNKARSGENRFGPGFGALQNIWIMPFEKPEKARQLTENGGIMPVFSPDGEKILFVNDNNKGNLSHIYEIEISSGISRQITSADAIDINPGYTTNGKNIIFTRIYHDTNNDGVVDYRDHGQIMILPVNIPKSLNEEIIDVEPIQLTSINENIFNTKVTRFLGGSILFALKEGDNINLAVIPESGLYPIKKSSIEQMEYALKLSESSPRDSVLALSQLEFMHDTDPLKLFVSTLKNFELLERYKSLNVDKKMILNQIEKKISENNRFEKAMLDIYYINNFEEKPQNYSYIFPETSAEDYLKHIYEFPLSFINVRLKGDDNSTSPENIFTNKSIVLSLNDQSILGYLFEKYARVLFHKGKIGQARKVYQSILYNLPEYYNNASILYSLGTDSLDTDIPPEFLHILSPIQYPYSINSNLNTSYTNREPQNEKISTNINAKIKSQVENDIFNFYKKIYSQNQEQLINNLKDKYTKTKDPFIYSLAQLSLSQNLMEHQNYNQALVTLQEIDNNIFKNTVWNFKYILLHGQILEKTNRLDNAYELYVNALLQYEKKYLSHDIHGLILNVFNHYRKLANIHKTHGHIEKAWNAYSPLLKLILHLEPQKLTEYTIEQLSLSIFIELDDMLLNSFNSKNITVKHALDFYSTNTPYARKNTLNSFIFGRAYLNAMLGIKLHMLHESNRELNKVNKETILTYFYEAEEDFQWSIYAEPSFADSYVMLGWIYQFIDEKRDEYVFLARTGIEKELDKNLFKSLYDKYFPDYLYEKNIQLYQKSIAFLSGKSSSQILQSFYLNLANNYFLLSNYTKADEFYSKISVEKANKFVFENDKQAAQYFFHLGKTNYFLGHYTDATNNLEKALNYYPLQSGKKELSKNSVYSKRILILKYIGLVYSDAGQYSRAINIYKQILKESKEVNPKDNLSTIYLEIARNILSRIKVSHNLNGTEEALEFTKLADATIKKFPEEIPPRFPYKFKILGISLPFPIYFGNYDNNFVNGENHLAFRLPTINQYQYLYSIQTDLYKLNGNYRLAAKAINKLIEYTDKDDSKHGRQTRLIAFMRLGELKFIEGDLISSKNAYIQARKMALSENVMNSYYLAEKNLMTIACREIDQSSTNKQKSELAHVYLNELDNFKANYFKQKFTHAQEEIASKNRKMKLTRAEKNRIEQEAMIDISSILIYRSIFETYISLADEQIETNGNNLRFSNYYDYKINNYKKHKSALISLGGDITVNNITIPLYDKKKRKRMTMVLEMNKALVLESTGKKREAMDIYSSISNQAQEFKANDLFIISAYRFYKIAVSLNIDAYKVLHTLDTTFKLNPYLIKKHLDIYQNLTTNMLEENIYRKLYFNVIYLENYNRMMEIQNTVDKILGNPDGEIESVLSEYKELDKIEEILSLDIENLKIKRESTDSLDAIMDQLLNRKSLLKETILQNPKLSGYAFARFPDMLTVNEIMNMKPGYLYLIQRKGITNVIFKSIDENKFDFDTFKINPEEVTKFTEYMQNPDIEFNDYSQISNELKRFIKWIKTKQIKLIFPDKIYSFFPFSKILNYQVATEYTVQAAILFEKNQSISTTGWLTNTNNKIHEGNLTEYSHFTYSKISRPDDVQKLKGKYNAIDYEITESDFADNSLILNKILTNSQTTSVALLSYNLKSSENITTYMNSLNLLFAASKSAMVIHSFQDRKSASKSFDKVINHKTDNSDNLLFDGNLNTSYIVLNLNSDENKSKFIEYEIDELHTCISEVDKLIKNSINQDAIEKIKFCENIDFDRKVNQMAFQNKLNQENLNRIKPEYNLFFKKIELMLNDSSRYNLSDVQKVYDSFKEKHILDNGSLEEEFYKYQEKYISLLFSHGETAFAINALKSFSDEHFPNHEKIIELIENFFLGKVFEGNIEELSKEIPVELLSLGKNQQNFNEIPMESNDRIRYFIEKSHHPKKWFISLLNSGEYENIIGNFSDANFEISNWKAISFLSSKGVRPGKIQSNEVQWILQLLQNPNNADFLRKIVTESTDDNLISFAHLIVSLNEKNYDNVVSIMKSVAVNKNDDEFFIKKTFIEYLLNRIDFYTTPDEFMSNIIKIISTMKFNIDFKNKQQLIFSKLVSSALLFINSSSELNRFLENYPDGLSEVNIAFIQRLKILSLQVNPFEAIHQKRDEVNPIYHSIEYNIALARLESNILDNQYFESSFNDVSTATLYQLNAINYQAALSGYFSYDRNQIPENFPFTKSVHGIFRIFMDQYYHWSWNQDSIQFTRIKLADIDKIILQNKNNIFYLSAKDEIINDKLLSNNLGLHFFSATTTMKSESNISSSTNLTWNYNQELRDSVGYSIMTMYLHLPAIQEFDQLTLFGYNSNIVSSSVDRSLINFYFEPTTVESIKSMKNTGNFHILYLKPEGFNIYLLFMKEFYKLAVEKMDTPTEIFDVVLKKLEKKYSGMNALQHLIILQK